MVRHMRLPKYVYPDPSRHGKMRYYMCRGRHHPKFRVRSELGSADFYNAYARFLQFGNPNSVEAPTKILHLAERIDPVSGQESTQYPSRSLGWLFDQYQRSTKWRDLGTSTKRTRIGIMRKITQLPHPRKKGQIWGECPLDAIQAQQIKEIRDANLVWRPVLDPDTGEETDDLQKANTEGSNSWLRLLRAVFSWGFNDQSVNLPTDPTIGIKLYSGSVEGFHCWSMAEIAAYRDRHKLGSMARLALEMLLLTGQRRSDIVRLGEGLMDSDTKGRPRFKFTQVKNGKTARPTLAVVPYWPELQAVVAATRGAGRETFIAQANGKPYTPESFGNMFRVWCDEAGLSQCSAHGLRKAFVVEMIRKRRRPAEVMAVTGHTTQKEFDRYARAYLRENAAEQLLDDWLVEAITPG